MGELDRALSAPSQAPLPDLGPAPGPFLLTFSGTLALGWVHQ